MPQKMCDVFRPLAVQGLSPRGGKDEQSLFKKPFEYTNIEENSDNDKEEAFNITHLSLQTQTPPYAVKVLSQNAYKPNSSD